ncbi:MAG: leucine-rich repeat protein [Prevotella sp.]|nr:leucine-rich repeat protein [Prevotella sp.]
MVERNVTDEQGVQYTLRQNETESYYAVTGNNGALAERVTLPEKLNGLNVTRIESNSFKDCTGMKWISIPASVTDIPSKSSVFSGCSLTLSLNQPLVSGWSSCDFITEVELGSKVDSLGYQAFYSCKNLTKVTYSEGLHGIGNSAFSGCTALSNVILPESLVTLGESVFSGCTSIEEITIPKNVTMDNRYSTYSPFCGCTGLKSVTIHTQRFSNWFYGLTNIKKVYIGSEVTSFTTNNGPSLRGTQGTLEGCTGIEIIEVDAANPIFDSRDGCNAIIETATNILKAGCKTTVIPQTITSIDGSAFYGCIDLKEITIPTQVTSIGDNAFYNCTSLQGINIPAQVTNIGNNAFSGCIGLQTITSYLKKPFSISAFSSETLSSATLRIPFGRTKAYQATNGWGFQTIEEMEGVGDEISFIQFAAAATKEACVKRWDENGDGEISLEEAKMVTVIDWGYFSEITSFDELKYFTNVTTIGSSAFSECKALTSITIPNGVTSIGANAFYGCVSLATIVLPDSLTCIEAGTFKNCSALMAVTIPNSVTSIGNNAFEGCTNLSEINLPEGLLTIGEKAFYGSGLLEMTLPSTLTSIGNYSLAGNVIHCLLTTPISVGTLMYNASDVVLYVPKGCEQTFSQAAGWKDFLIVGAGSNEPTDWTTGVVTVKVEEPGGLRLAVVELDNEEISRLKIIGQLNSSDLQYLVEGNGKIANIESIDMSEVTLDYDGGCYYSGSSSGIGDTGLGSSVVNYYLTEEEHISTSRMPGIAPVTYYSYYGPNLLGVFSDKPYKHIVMPTSVKKAANGVFGGCKNLQSVEFPSGMSSIGTGAFSNCERLQSIDVQGIDTIPDNAFAGCRMLQSVDHMNNVKYIGSYAFSGCKMLQSIDHINNVDYIGKSAFYGCIMLNDIQFSENLTYIGEHAFDGCKTLPTVTLPSSLSSLSEETFSNCSMLKQVIFSPELMQVDYSSFNNTPWLKSLPTENGIKYMGHIALCYDEEMKTAAVPPTTLDFREGTTYIADRFISSVYYVHVQSITSIKLPTSLIKIGDNAFANTQISSLTLPENLEIIGKWAFCRLQQLTKVTLSEKLRLIGDEAFGGCSGLIVVNYNAIKAAGDNLFNNCTSLEKVNIGAKVQLLPDGIFAKCKSLTIVKFEERNNATPLVIGNSVFSGCENLSNIKLPGNTEAIGDAAFSGCSGLTTFTVPQGVSVVSGAMLSGCSGLTTVQLHESITTISDAAFNGCSKVTSFSLPEKVDSIGASAFSGCYELKELTIPASVTRLGNSFVGDCYQLTRLVTKIREPQALSSIIPMSATIVQEVYHHYSNWSLYSDIHYDEVTLVVPDGCKQRYKDTDGWKLFKNVETESGNDFTDTNKFYVSENVVVKGHTTRMGINLVNSANDLVAYQVDLIVPLGFKLTTNANGQYEIVKGQRYENNSHSITVEKLPDYQYATVNKYRIVCMSTSNARITGNDGLLLNVNLYASENYEEGDYKATLDNIIVSKSDGTVCELDYVPFNITVTNTTNVLKGDANDDGEIDVADVVQTVNYILGRTPNVFARQNADVNEDGEINVGALVGIVAIIANTYSDAGNNRAASPVEGGHLSGVLAADAATLRVENPQDFTAFQMLITLPWETDKEQFELKLRGASDHVVMTNWLSEHQVMVVAYSVGLHSLAAGGNAFLQIVTDNAQKGEWKFEDIVFARANGTTCKFEPLYLSQTTGIGDEVVQDGKDERMYDLSGRPVMGNSLKKGLYIKGNKKILVK